MTTLSPSQRLKAYRWAYEQIGARTGWCFHICGRLRNFLNHEVSLDDIPRVFSELKLLMPSIEEYPDSEDGGPWFEYNLKGQSERLTCLAFCIAICEMEIKNSNQ